MLQVKGQREAAAEAEPCRPAPATKVVTPTGERAFHSLHNGQPSGKNRVGNYRGLDSFYPLACGEIRRIQFFAWRFHGELYSE
jgi:hypothetical protein